MAEKLDTSRSSFVDWARYDGGNLVLSFEGRRYDFEGVPSRVWEGFKKASSFGSYYHQEIKGRYSSKSIVRL